jgi:hypothetical protein
MKYITLKHEYNGRSGHCLKDFFTCYIFSFLIKDLTVLPMQACNSKQQILKFPINKNLEDYKFSQSIDIKELNWDGMSFETFCKIKNKISDLPNNSLITLRNHTRIHPHQLTEWFKCKLINEDVFIAKFIPTLRSLYFKKNNPKTLDCLSIHVRRGDVANPSSPYFWSHAEMRWPTEHFEKYIISFQKKMPNLPINIFTEKYHSDDLEILKKYDNLTIHRGDVQSLQDDINKMVNSKYFMPSNSSLSTWISYISKGSIIISKDQGPIKHFHSEHIW